MPIRTPTVSAFILILILGLVGARGEGGTASRSLDAAPEIRSALADTGIAAVREVLAPQVVLAFGNEPPFAGERPVREMLEMLVRDRELVWRHRLGATVAVDGGLEVRGTVISRLLAPDRRTAVADTSEFRWRWGRAPDGGWSLERMLYGEVPDPLDGGALPAPTGPYRVGTLSTVLVDADRPESLTPDPDDRRRIGVQLWYPAEPGTGRGPAPYRTPAQAEAAAEFLGWPVFANSFTTLVRTHSLADAAPAAAAGRCPVLFYNHGYSGHAAVHQSLFEDLASHGYVVASLGHAHESSVLLRDDGSVIRFDPEAAPHRLRRDEASGDRQEAAKDRIIGAPDSETRLRAYRELHRLSPRLQESVRIWAADCRAVREALADTAGLGSAFADRLDLDRVGAIGHSLGGAVAGQLAAFEPWVAAGVNLDGFQYGDLIDRPLTRPFLFVGAHRPWSGEEMIVNDVFYQASTAPAYLVLCRGFEHGTFTDLPLFGMAQGAGEDDRGGRRAVALQREIVRDFFDHHLRGRPSGLLSGDGDERVAIRSRNTGRRE